MASPPSEHSAVASDEQTIRDAQRTLHDQLTSGGFLVDSGIDGLYLRSHAFESLCRSVDDLVTRAGQGEAIQHLHGPLVMTRALLDQTDYVRSFPNLIGAVSGFTGGEQEHGRLLHAMESGQDWADTLHPTDLGLCSAACHPIYPSQRGRLPSDGRVIEIVGECFRHEPSIDPMRMQVFHQHEYVALGTVGFARAHRDQWVDRALAIHRSIGLEVDAVVANDPFFGRSGRMLAANQREEDLKIEIVTPMYGCGQSTAITSANCHLDHFGVAFGIENEDGQPAHSACVGFGTERIVVSLLADHGLNQTSWPSTVRATLQLN